MSLLHKTSLAATVDAVTEAFFFGRVTSKADMAEAASWIARRVGPPDGERFRAGSYRGMFAPTEADFADGIRLFTGERIVSRAGTAHVLGQEACRAVTLLGLGGKASTDALHQARQWMLAPGAIRGGMYCCATCSCALWRHLSVSDMGGTDRRLADGVNALKRYRAGNGRWQRFPFYYTLFALLDVNLKSARDELRYAAPACEALLRRVHAHDKYAARRKKLMEKVLAGV